MPAVDHDRKVYELIVAWLKRGADLGAANQLAAIKDALYAYRNNVISEKDLSPDLVSDNTEVMAAVEHYFYARSEVCSGEYSRTNMKAMIIGYQIAKGLGLDLRHNRRNPTTPASDLQKKWALVGTDQGAQDLVKANGMRKALKQPLVEPPTFRLPPNFTGKYKTANLDRFKY